MEAFGGQDRKEIDRLNDTCPTVTIRTQSVESSAAIDTDAQSTAEEDHTLASSWRGWLVVWRRAEAHGRSLAPVECWCRECARWTDSFAARSVRCRIHSNRAVIRYAAQKPRSIRREVPLDVTSPFTFVFLNDHIRNPIVTPAAGCTTLGSMDEKAARCAALMTVRRELLDRFPPG
jgi:hypothetical protein